MSCEIYTKKGKPCPFSAKTVSKETTKNVCNIHSETCKINYRKYKNVCSKIWDKKCSIHDNEKTLKTIIKFAQQCQDQRIEYTGECCNNSWDNGHRGAVIKMTHIIDKCEESLENLEQDEDEGWTRK